MKPILSMSEATDPAQAGGKGAALAALVDQGFDVPEFLVLTEAGFSPDDPTLLRPELQDDLMRAVENLGPGLFAVRSSAKREDGAQDSHAGQFDSVLNVTTDGLLAAIKQVRASGLSGPVETYREMKGIDGAELPAVVVQRMVPARAAGVAFSADPVSGARGVAVISAVAGLGEALVAGEVDGETWRVTPDGGAILDGTSQDQVLSPDEAAEVAGLAARAEATFGAPQDIEWAYDGSRLRLLQSRAITAGLRPIPTPDENLVVLDNSNIIESYPGLVSPLTYSFAAYSYNRVYCAFVALLGLRPAAISANAAIFANLLTRYRGRVYYNLGNWYRALALLPGFALNRGFMETMMGVDEPLPAELTSAIAPAPPQGFARVRAYAEMARVAFGLLWQALILPRTKARFLARLETALSEGPSVQDANLTELAQTYRRIEAALLDQWDAPLVNDFLCMVSFGASRKLLMAWGGDEAGAAFHNDIMIGQGDIVSAEPAARIAKAAQTARRIGAVDTLVPGAALPPELQSEIDAYLEKFGDRCTEELKLESIPLSEDPAPLLAAIQASARMDRNPPQTRAAPDWNSLIPNPAKRRLAMAFCAYASTRVRDRENLRFERTRIFGQARRVFRAMGHEFYAQNRLDNPEDIFHLTVDEILGAIEGAGLTEDLRARASARKTEANGFGPEPPRRILIRGHVFENEVTSSVAPEGQARTGTGCSAGRITATARVIHDPRTQALGPGEILVARNTDPGWIAVFANASGIVVERGSLLSHSAIVARELGIPCVVGIPDATDWVHSGETLTLDGATGEVTKHD